MIKEEWGQITENRDVRQNLSRIRQEIKDQENFKQLSGIFTEQEQKQTLMELLHSEDAKTRKNAALLMGDLGILPTSIRPVNAALTAALVKEYMKENAQVLDPFCGVGTMLIERYKTVKAGSSYGVDIQEDAVLKARKNTEAAGQLIHYINRDFFRFEHDYLFDEVITNMPFKIGRITEEEVTELYKRFFHTVSRYLKKDALMILYSHDRELAQWLAPRSGFQIFKEFEISKKEGTYVLLLRLAAGNENN